MSGFNYPNFGKQVKVQQHGREVRLIFTAATRAQSDDFFEMLLDQLKGGALKLTLMGKLSSITEESDDGI